MAGSVKDPDLKRPGKSDMTWQGGSETEKNNFEAATLLPLKVTNGASDAQRIWPSRRSRSTAPLTLSESSCIPASTTSHTKRRRSFW